MEEETAHKEKFLLIIVLSSLSFLPLSHHTYTVTTLSSHPLCHLYVFGLVDLFFEFVLISFFFFFLSHASTALVFILSSCD